MVFAWGGRGWVPAEGSRGGVGGRWEEQGVESKERRAFLDWSSGEGVRREAVSWEYGRWPTTEVAPVTTQRG